MIIADTSAWIDYFRGIESFHTDVLDYELSRSRIGTGDLIITEFLQGFRNDKDFQDAKTMMDSLQYFDLAGKEIATAAAQNFRILRKEGITVRKTIDVLIATFCIVHNFELIHNDREFEPFEIRFGLKVRKRIKQ